jgi:adenylyl- and sulfurtransferase ThiI
MNRPKYKELYLKEKSKAKFSYDLLMNIVDMLNKVGIKAETHKRFRTDSFMITAVLNVHNPYNKLYGCIAIDEDLLEGTKEGE